MNTAIIIGRTTKDVELNYSQSQMAIARFIVAVDRDRKEGETDFIQCVAFGKTAEFMQQYVVKGTKIAVRGSIRTSTSEVNGEKRYYTNVAADKVEVVEWKKSAEKKEDVPEGFDMIQENMPF